MRTQEERDEQTLVIASALPWLVLVMVATFATLAILSPVIDASGGAAGTMLTAAVLVAGALAFVRLARRTRR